MVPSKYCASCRPCVAAFRSHSSAFAAYCCVAWSPVVDIEETELNYLIRAELPGLRKENVKEEVEDGVLTLSGERDLERKVEGKTFHHIERSHGTFPRSFTLPENAEAESVSAKYKEGLLEIRVVKCEEAQPKSSEVRVE